jgi:restriction system protein
LTILQSLPAAGFERLSQRLLREAGFEQVTVTGPSGDGGIDGIGILELTPAGARPRQTRPGGEEFSQHG